MKIIIPHCRLSYPRLDKPEAFADGAPRFSANFILDEADPRHAKSIKEVKAAISSLVEEKFKGKSPGADRLCLRPGTEKDVDGYGEGTWYVSTSARPEDRPDVRNRQAVPVRPGEQGWPYAGCYVRAIFSLWAQDNQYGRRINAQLVGVQFIEDGEGFSGSARADDDDFDTSEASAEEEVTEDDPWS